MLLNNRGFDKDKYCLVCCLPNSGDDATNNKNMELLRQIVKSIVQVQNSYKSAFSCLEKMEGFYEVIKNDRVDLIERIDNFSFFFSEERRVKGSARRNRIIT